MLSICDFHNKFHQNWTKIGPKLAKLVFWGGLGGWGVGWSDQKTSFIFELCSLFMTHTPIFIHFGPKLAKLVFWGGSGGMGWGGWGGLGGPNQKITLDLSFAVHS